MAHRERPLEERASIRGRIYRRLSITAEVSHVWIDFGEESDARRGFSVLLDGEPPIVGRVIHVTRRGERALICFNLKLEALADRATGRYIAISLPLTERL